MALEEVRNKRRQQQQQHSTQPPLHPLSRPPSPPSSFPPTQDQRPSHADDIKLATARISSKLTKGDMGVAGNVFQNLAAIHPWASYLPQLRKLMMLINDVTAREVRQQRRTTTTHHHSPPLTTTHHHHPPPLTSTHLHSPPPQADGRMPTTASQSRLTSLQPPARGTSVWMRRLRPRYAHFASLTSHLRCPTNIQSRAFDRRC